MTFLVAIHKDAASSYGVSVPDLPGCVTAGETIEEALTMAKEAIELHLEGMLDDNLDLPDPTEDIERFRNDADYAAAIWGAVRVHIGWRRSSSSAA
jgi:predicted RNase H-like HicB family nuclease